MRTLIRRGVTVLAVVALHVSFAAAQSAPAAGDLDLLMKAVLANRDQSWRKLQEYLLAEREKINEQLQRIKQRNAEQDAKDAREP